MSSSSSSSSSESVSSESPSPSPSPPQTASPSPSQSALDKTMARLLEALEEVDASAPIAIADPDPESVEVEKGAVSGKPARIEPWTPDEFWINDSDHDGLEDDLEDGEFPSGSSASESDSDSEPITVCKNFAFRHPDLEDEPTDDGSNPYLNALGLETIHPTRDQIASPEARKVMRRQIFYDYYRDIGEFREVRGSYLRCQQGGDYFCDTYKRRKEPDTFQVCPVPHGNGAIYVPYRCKTRLSLEAPTTRRPPHLVVNRRRTGPIWRRRNFSPLRECARCKHHAFKHHDNPDDHYYDYVDQVQYQGKNPDAIPADKQVKYLEKKIENSLKKRRGRKYLPPAPVYYDSQIRMTNAAIKAAAATREKRRNARKQRQKPDSGSLFPHIVSRVDTSGPESFVKAKGIVMNPNIQQKQKPLDHKPVKKQITTDGACKKQATDGTGKKQVTDGTGKKQMSDCACKKQVTDGSGKKQVTDCACKNTTLKKPLKKKTATEGRKVKPPWVKFY